MVDDSTSWIAETREAVDRASNVVQAQADYEALASIDEELDNAVPDLAQLEHAAVIGRGAWWAGVDAPPDLWADLRSAQQHLGRRQLASVVRLLTPFRARVRRVIQERWKEHVVTEAGDAAELRNLVRVLTGAEGLEDIARNLDEALGRLTRLQSDLPDAHALTALNEAVELLAALEARLPTEVKAFVSAAAHGGASLELLDADVRGWLVDNGALHNFRVVPGRPQAVPRG